MSLLSFLGKASVEEAKEPVKVGATGPRKQRNPNPAILAIRAWYDGSVYPSQALVDKFDLEYRVGTVEHTTAVEAVGTPGAEGYKAAVPAKKSVKQVEGACGNGFDIIDSKEWSQLKDFGGRMLFIGAVPKNSPKVDLFGATTYEEDGKPKTSVIDQGAATFGTKRLLPMLKEIYGIELAKTEEGKPTKEFVDLIVFAETDGVNINTQFSTKLLLAPKVISRGDAKDTATYERRENVTLYGLAPESVLTPQGNEEPVPTPAANAEA